MTIAAKIGRKHEGQALVAEEENPESVHGLRLIGPVGGALSALSRCTALAA